MAGRLQHLLRPIPYNVVKCKSRDEFFFPVEKVLTSDLMPNYLTTSENEYSIVGTIEPGQKKLLYTCSKAYNLVSNAELYLPIEKALHDKGIKFNVVYSHIAHQKFSADYILEDSVMYINSPDDTIMPKFQIQHSYDGGLKLNITFGIFRLVCSNGLTIPMKGTERLNFNVTSKHTDRMNTVVAGFMKHLKKFMFAWENKAITSNFVDMSGTAVKSVKDRIAEVAHATNFPKRLLADTEAIVERERKMLGYDIANEWLVYNALNEVLFSTKSNMHIQAKNMVDEKVIDHMLFPKKTKLLKRVEEEVEN